MPNPSIPGVTYPIAYDTVTLTAFIANNYDVAITSPGRWLVYAINGPVTAVINSIPLAQQFNQAGLLVVNSLALLSQLVNSGVRFSTEFTSTFLPNLQTTMVKNGLLAQTPAQVQTRLNAIASAFVANPLS